MLNVLVHFRYKKNPWEKRCIHLGKKLNTFYKKTCWFFIAKQYCLYVPYMSLQPLQVRWALFGSTILRLFCKKLIKFVPRKLIHHFWYASLFWSFKTFNPPLNQTSCRNSNYAAIEQVTNCITRKNRLFSSS